MLTSIWWVRVWAILIGTQQFPVLLSISLRTYVVEHLLKCLFSICITSLMKYLLRSLTHFLIDGFFPYCWVLRVLVYFEKQSFIRCAFCQIVSPSLGLSSRSLDTVFHRAALFCFVFLSRSFKFSWKPLPLKRMKTPFAATWMELENVTLSEVSQQRRRNIVWYRLYVESSNKKQTMIQMSLLTKQTDSQTLRKSLRLLRGRMGEGLVRQFGMDMHTLLYLKWINNRTYCKVHEALLNCHVAAWTGGCLEKWVHVCVRWSHFAVHLKLSQCCLLISCTSIQNKKSKKVLKESSWSIIPFLDSSFGVVLKKLSP